MSVSCQFWHNIVVVGVKPLGHLASGSGAAGAIIGTPATCGTEVSVQLRAFFAGGPDREVSQSDGHIQHLVVKGKISHRHVIELGLLLPVAPAQIGCRDGQFLCGLPAAPIVFQREFQLALATDTGEAEVMCGCHDRVLESCVLSQASRLGGLLHE